MNSDDKPEPSGADLVLEILEESPVPVPRKGAATFKIDTRGGGERRKLLERRHDIRFEGCRRNGMDRRAHSNPWKPGTDI